jgi:hypothetical protein
MVPPHERQRIASHAIQPEIVVVCSGRKVFGGTFLPDATTLQRFCCSNPNARIYRTDHNDAADGLTATNDADGDPVVIRTNGSTVFDVTQILSRPGSQHRFMPAGMPAELNSKRGKYACSASFCPCLGLSMGSPHQRQEVRSACPDFVAVVGVVTRRTGAQYEVPGADLRLSGEESKSRGIFREQCRGDSYVSYVGLDSLLSIIAMLHPQVYRIPVYQCIIIVASVSNAISPLDYRSSI